MVQPLWPVCCPTLVRPFPVLLLLLALAELLLCQMLQCCIQCHLNCCIATGDFVSLVGSMTALPLMVCFPLALSLKVSSLQHCQCTLVPGSQSPLYMAGLLISNAVILGQAPLFLLNNSLIPAAQAAQAPSGCQCAPCRAAGHLPTCDLCSQYCFRTLHCG